MRRRVIVLGFMAPAGVALALAGVAAAPAPAEAADPPRLITSSRVTSIACVPALQNTARARVKLWMRVVNDNGIGEWADRMEAKARLEATTAGTNITRKWIAFKTPGLLQDRVYRYNINLLTDNLSASADWRVHVKLIWHRPFPIKNVAKDFYFDFDASCGVTSGGVLPPPGAALPAPGAGS